jgi:diketogulonate reductase-like aldo/keto reductase
VYICFNLYRRTNAFGMTLKLGVEYVDLYLIHPRFLQTDIPTAWATMEKILAQGLTKSIGVSNFGVRELKILLASAKVKPAVNQVNRYYNVFVQFSTCSLSSQIELHPYVYANQIQTIRLCAEQGIVIEGFSSLMYDLRFTFIAFRLLTRCWMP